MKKLFIFFYSAFLIFNSAFSFGQQAPGIEWQHTIGGNYRDDLISIRQTSDGGFILGGISDSDFSGNKTENSNGDTDYWIVKTDASGNIEWDNTVGGNYSDNLTSILQTVDGGYILGGYSASDISGDKTQNSKGSYDFWIVKIDFLGNIEWQNTIGGADDDRLYSVYQTTDGGYILGGFSTSNISGDKTENSNGLNDFWIVKIDVSGNIVWQKTIGGNLTDMLYSVTQTNDGGYILGGYSDSNISGDKTANSKGGFDYWIVKTNTTGNIQWQQTIGGDNDDNLTSISQTSDGGFIVGGTSNSYISGDKTENSLGLEDYWIVKLDSQGNIQWQNTIGGDLSDVLTSFQQTADEGYILGGWSVSNMSGDKTENRIGYDDYWVIKTDSAGNITWENTIGGAEYEQLESIQQTGDGGYILGGYSRSGISGDKTEANLDSTLSSTDYWLIKLYPDTITEINNLQITNYDLKVFPNPAKDEITIAGYTLQNSQLPALKIYDVMGKEVFSHSIINHTSQIVNLKSFTSGVYFVQLQTGAKVSRVKFIKQ